MVVHDNVKQVQWAEQNKSLQQEKKNSKVAKKSTLSLLAVQSLSCVVIILLALLLRVAGGDSYAQVQQGLTMAFSGNEWFAAMMRLWDGEAAELAVSDVKLDDFTQWAAQ